MIRINQLKLNPNHTMADMYNAVAKLLNTEPSKIKDNITIVKRSVDSRKKPDIKYVYCVDIAIKDEDKILKRLKNPNISKADKKTYDNIFSPGKKDAPPVITGMGPAGIFCGLMLARAGLNPIIIERGEDVDSRTKKVDKFFLTNELDVNSNVQFGEGGAGTFSDGKLNTMVKDPYGRIRYVLETFVKYGAPEEILYINKPHIGTDVLSKVIKNMREDIINLGGKVLFNTKLTDIDIKDGQLSGIYVNNSEYIECSRLVLAIGHSARDTFSLIKSKKLEMNAKAFAVGIRIEHPQVIINRNAYGDTTYTTLPVADYKVTHNLSNKRGVYSFCMCPGGYVVNSSSEEGMTAINGMSYSKRDSKNANSALIVTVTPDDYGSDDVLAGVAFQRKLERQAFLSGKGNIPVSLYKEYKANEISKEYRSVTPCHKGKDTFANINEILPDFINDALKEGIENFARQIEGYNNDDVIISAVESRTSSPVRILRDDENFESNIKGIHPCGEGAGYAGGITSAAVDGIKVAEKIYKLL